MMDLRGVLSKLEVKQTEEEAEVWQQNKWLNRDNVPLPASRRNWGFWSYVAFWVTSGVNVSGWAAGASFLSLGMTVGQAMAANIVGSLLVNLAVIATGQVGAYWHVGFPLWNRQVWGLRASYFPLLNRIVLSFTWCATQGWLGGKCLKTFIGSFAPGIYTIHNVMPVSTGMDSSDFLCYVLFTLITLPVLLIPAEKLHRPMVVCASCSTVAAFSLFIWALAKGHGAGPLVTSRGFEYIGVEPVHGSNLAWAFFHTISAGLGGICAGILNQSDYTRFAIRPRDPFLSVAICNPIIGVLTSIIGITCASVAAEAYPGVLLWTPYDLLTAIQMNGGNGARAAVFFASLAFVLAQLAINVPGNCIAGGIDLTSLLPRYINIRRGAYITVVISIAMCPWALMSGATAFISVMSGYAVFLAPITGLMVFDYFFVHQRKMKLSALYDGTPNSIYWYWKGLNWRAPIAWAFGVAPMFPGFLQSVGATTVSLPLTHMYYLCWPAGFAISGVVYVALCKLFPLGGIGEVDEYDIFGTFGEPQTETGRKIAEDVELDEKNKSYEATAAIATLHEVAV